MNRQQIVNTIGVEYLTANIEEDEYSYAKIAGSKARLEELVGHPVEHYKLDRRFEHNSDTGDFVILVETKQNYTDEDILQLKAYLELERAINKGKKVICILANTTANDNIMVWKSEINDEHFLKHETILESMEYYESLFAADRQNDREKVMKNTYALNELLHRMEIPEELRSQFIGTCLLYVKDEIPKVSSGGYVDQEIISKLKERWASFSPAVIRTGIESVLAGLLDGSRNKDKKIDLLQKSVLNNQHVKKLSITDWQEILGTVVEDIYRYIDENSSEGQDILNLFFITFNKYVTTDKNQAFTPDHITDFMTKITGVDRNSRVLDICCGSGSFLVQAMVKELADARKNYNAADARVIMQEIKETSYEKSRII